MSRRPVWIRKASGVDEVFSRAKLVRSLLRTGTPRRIAENVAEQVEHEIRPGMSTREIFRIAKTLLLRQHRQGAHRYGLKRAIFELGPSGYPFEKYVGELFRRQGYRVKTNQMIAGHCVNHEVDAVAENNQELIWIECKFHHQQGTVSDLKTALYVYARYLDLAERSDSQLKKRMALVTNTHFSDEAIRFGECRGLILLGWDYPNGNSLRSLVERHHLLPLTCLSSLSKVQKEAFLNQGRVLASDLKNDSQFWKRTPPARRARLQTDLQELGIK